MGPELHNEKAYFINDNFLNGTFLSSPNGKSFIWLIPRTWSERRASGSLWMRRCPWRRCRRVSVKHNQPCREIFWKARATADAWIMQDEAREMSLAEAQTNHPIRGICAKCEVFYKFAKLLPFRRRMIDCTCLFSQADDETWAFLGGRLWGSQFAIRLVFTP